MEGKLRVCCFQTNGVKPDSLSGSQVNSANVQLLHQVVRDAQPRADLFVFPELFLCGYNIGDDVKDRAEYFDGPSFQSIAAVAKEFGVFIVYGYAEKIRTSSEESKESGKTGVLYNSAIVIDSKGKLVTNYRKTHLYDPFRKWERVYFTPGDDYSPLFSINGVKIGIMICWDVEFPEPVRVLALRGAQFIVVPTANTAKFTAEVTVASRAFENGIFVCYCNRCGTEKDLTYCGKTVIVAPDGKAIAMAPEKEEQTIVAEIWPDNPLYKEERKYNPYFADRRPELYKQLLES